MEGENLVQDWAISVQSFVLKTYVDQDSWELYKACLFPRDQATLVPTAHTQIEEYHAHVLTQAMAFGHHLSLRCSYLRKEKITSDEKLSKAQKQLEESNKLRTVAEERVKQLEAQLEDLTLQSRIEVDTARTVALEAGKKEGFSVSCLAVEIKATKFLDQGFERCKSQVLKLKGFTEGFDLSWLDPTLDGNLAAFPEEEVPPPVDEEFKSLIEEVEKMDAPLELS
ncbi:hypothetical protein Salat_2148400 [Sesamum alatum]|uniref:Uncharacterized protein n=1 Tax=Sesamum alatum TaxID=300844 RepID=A0AAE1Y2B0_9LAMI|nr:hypothetical protein Salat_2148400 [Sesamum alatum]